MCFILVPLRPQRFRCRFRVRHYECDAYGHLNNANYVRYMQEAAFDASAAVGYDKNRYEAMGYLWLAHETEIEYLQPVIYGDTIEVKTWVGDFRRVRSRRFYEFRKAGHDDLVCLHRAAGYRGYHARAGRLCCNQSGTRDPDPGTPWRRPRPG